MSIFKAPEITGHAKLDCIARYLKKNLLHMHLMEKRKVAEDAYFCKNGHALVFHNGLLLQVLLTTVISKETKIESKS